jgi:Protein kinase domain
VTWAEQATSALLALKEAAGEAREAGHDAIDAKLLAEHDYESSPPSMTWAAAIVAQIAAVLADLHQVDIVHRDIKPSNVMIVDGGLVKVLDFGIAILRGTGALPRLTQVDRTVGTPPYMSPEQCLGQPVTSASDIYSLGCLLLELLTGDVPFFATGDTSLRAHHLNTPAPSARLRREDIPLELDTLVSSMLAKAPEARPSAAAVYETLLPWTTTGSEGTGTMAAGGPADPGDSAENRDPSRPFRWPLLAPAKSRSAHGAVQGGRLTELEARHLLDSARVLLDSDRPSAAIGLLDDGVERSGHDPALQLRLRHLLGAALFYAGEYTRAATVLDAAGRDYRRYFDPHDPEVLDCAYHAGYAYAETGKPDKALPQLRFYVQNAHMSIGGEEARKILETRFVIAQLLAADGYPDEALVELRAVRPLLVDTFGLTPSSSATSTSRQPA